MKLPRTYRLQEIAEMLQLPFTGNPDINITGISDVYHATHEDITFADNEKYFELANLSNASVIIVQRGINFETNKGIILTNDAFHTYNQLVSILFPFTLQTQLIHTEAIIGEHTILYPNVYIERNVTIGKHCVIHPHVTIYGPCQIGNNVTIYSGAIIGSDAFYFKKDLEHYQKLQSVGNVIIEDNVEIGSNTTIDRGLGGSTIIGKGTKIGNAVQIGHDTHIGNDCFIAAQTGIGSNVIIEDSVTIWAQVGIQKNVVIGKEAIILGQSGVTKSLEGGKIYFGLPAIESREKMKELSYLKQVPQLIKMLSEKL
ncbi:MAG: UDP-3-O-(3-hydroxymyristoyl)glucosamine N-acyltransferase [Bacteroidales bacterium]|nr:UDP-3-O-(3-hydroxymyristoyl)glucosamine N-acyltransferase [Bacteroidales bacterium]